MQHRLLALGDEFCLQAYNGTAKATSAASGASNSSSADADSEGSKGAEGRTCEIVQFISSMTMVHGDDVPPPLATGAGDTGNDGTSTSGGGDNGTTSTSRVVLSYGVNDCEGKLWSMPLSEVLAMLKTERVKQA